MKIDKDIVIFGTGQAAAAIADEFPDAFSFYVDNNEQKWGTTFRNREVKSPSVLDKDHHFVVVASMYFDEIAAQLKEIGYVRNEHFMDYEHYRMLVKVGSIRKVAFELFGWNGDGNTDAVEGVDRAFNRLFADFDRVLSYTNGLLTRYDVAAILYICLLQAATKPQGKVKALEIGSWTGFSSYFISKGINAGEQEGNLLFCVDSWGDFSAYAPLEAYTQYVDVMHIFRGLMRGLGVSKHIRVLNMVSSDAWDLMNDRLFDLIFIDGDHTYDFVKEDTLRALDKITEGGIVFGHDNHHHNRSMPPMEWFKANKSERLAFHDQRGYHPGVYLALHEIFEDTHVSIPYSSIWAKKITNLSPVHGHNG